MSRRTLICVVVVLVVMFGMWRWHKSGQCNDSPWWEDDPDSCSMQAVYRHEEEQYEKRYEEHEQRQKDDWKEYSTTLKP